MERTFYQEGFSHAFMLSNYLPLDMDGLANLEVFNYHLRTFPGQNKTVACSDELCTFVKNSRILQYFVFFSIVEASQKMQRIFWTQSLPNNITRHREWCKRDIVSKKKDRCSSNIKKQSCAAWHQV